MVDHCSDISLLPGGHFSFVLKPGLIAVVLGRLGMTINEAIPQYVATASAIFSKRNRIAAFMFDAYKATTLEHAVKKLVAKKCLGERMLDDCFASASPGVAVSSPSQATGCHAFVCAMPARNLTHVQRFHTYAARVNARPDCAIWQAVRATTALPRLFKLVTIAAAPGHAPAIYVKGSLRVNNPVHEVLDEARTVFGGTTRLGCLVSLGAGHLGAVSLSPAVGVVLKVCWRG
jgi:hypothetical protein